MESMKIDNFIEVLRSKDLVLFTYQDLHQLFPSITKSGLSAAIKRLIKSKTITRIEKARFQFLLPIQPVHEYQLANFIYQPSYVSLETALSFYGIIDQFTYQITSITTNKATVKQYLKKEYSYAHLEPKYFTDYSLQDGYLIATANKALFDFFYLSYRGFRSRQNLGLINLNKTQKHQFFSYVTNYHLPNLSKFIEKNL